MSGRRGTAAALPAEAFHRPPVLEKSGLIVTHINEKGDERASYDFATLPVAASMQRALAAVFAAKAAPGGAWRTLLTSQEMWHLVRAFARFLAEQPTPPTDLSQITPALWGSWRISRPTTQLGRRQINKIGPLLRLDPRLPADTRAVTRKTVTKIQPSETAYTSEEFREITRAATRSFQAAWRRITENLAHLERWRAGEFTEDTEVTEPWLLGEALQHLALTGDVPTVTAPDRVRPRMVVPRYAQVLGGHWAARTWQRLFLTSSETVSLAVLLTSAHGWNPTSVSELRLPLTMIGPDGQLVHRVELEKRRRHAPHRYETRNLTDSGPRSPGRLLTRAIEATAPARDLLAAAGAPSDRLLIWHAFKPLVVDSPAELLRFGFTGTGTGAVTTWKASIGAGELNLRRLRRTVNVLHRRAPNQNTQDTHDSVYVLTDPLAREQTEPVIAEGATSALHHALATVKARLSRDDTDADLGTDTATANCADYRHSPFSPHGSPCRASFLLCLACPNAVITPRHLPRLAYLHQALDALRGVLPAVVWEHDWHEHHQRLEHLKHQGFTTTEWADALAAADTTDRALIDQLLHRGFDS